MRTTYPPYKRLASAEARAQAEYPDAVRVRAIWTPMSDVDVHVEVWRKCERAGRLRANVVRP